MPGTLDLVNASVRLVSRARKTLSGAVHVGRYGGDLTLVYRSAPPVVTGAVDPRPTIVHDASLPACDGATPEDPPTTGTTEPPPTTHATGTGPTTTTDGAPSGSSAAGRADGCGCAGAGLSPGAVGAALSALLAARRRVRR